MIDTTERRAAVRERYARAALNDDNCCGPATSCEPSSPESPATATAAERISCAVGYDREEIDRIPDGANLGLGCGNPVALASLTTGETVIDLGAGGGIDCFLAAERVGPAGRVIGVDMTPEMVERARANARKGGFANVEFRLGEIEALPVADGIADAVISNCVLNLSSDRRRVLAEAMRALRPGGRVMISDLVSDRPPPDFVQSSRESLVGCLPVRIADYEADLAAAGFTDIMVEKRERYPAEHILADPQVQAVIRRNPPRETELRTFVQSIHGGMIRAAKPR